MQFRHFTNPYFCDILINRGKEKSRKTKFKKEVIKMETLKNMLEKLTKLSRECRYLESKPGLDEGLKKVLWKHNAEMVLLHMFAHQLANEVCPDMMITYEDVDDVFQDIKFTYHKYFLY